MLASLFKPRILFSSVWIVLLVSNVKAQTDSSMAFGRITDAFGVRIGIVANWLGNATPVIPNGFDAPPVGSGVRPLFEPYYEAHLEPALTAVASLMLIYRSFAVLDLSDTRFESFGFNVSTRWEPAANAGLADRTHFFFEPGLGFDTFDDRVSFSLALRAGELMPLGPRSELELGAIVTPELFLGVGPGMYYGITAGIRFVNTH